MPTPVPPNVVRSELEKILASRAFSQSESLKRFLRYVVHARLEGRENELKELSLGTEVFDRGDSFDPRIDPIVRVQATRLRGKLREYYLEEGAEAEVLIELPKGTYVPEFSTGAGQEPGSQGTPARRRWPARGTTLLMGAGVVVFALVGFLFRLRSGGDASLDLSELRSIAVLPFTDMSPGGDHEYYGDGLAEEITTTLARIPGLEVAPRTSAFRFKGANLDLDAIAAELSADAVLQGSLRRSGDALRIQVQLLQVAGGRQIWSATYDRPARDAFAVQEEIARSVAAAIERTLSTPLERDERYIPTAGAYEDYLHGRFEREKNTPPSLVRSIAFFESALDEDPDFAPAYAGLVQSYVLNVLWGFAPPNETREAAREASDRALELARDLPEALASAAFFQIIYEWDLDGAETLLESAGAASSEVRVVRGVLLAVRGHLEEAMREIDLARQDLPHAPTVHQLGASFAYHRRDYEDALARCRDILQKAPDYPLAWLLLSRTQSKLGRFEEAEASLAAFETSAAGTALALASRAVLHAEEGKEREAREELASLQALSQERYVPPAFLARVHSALGDFESALDELERAAAEHSFPLVFLTIDPISIFCAPSLVSLGSSNDSASLDRALAVDRRRCRDANWMS